MRNDKDFESIIFHLFFSIRIVAEFSETERQNLCGKLKNWYLNFEALGSSTVVLESI